MIYEQFTGKLLILKERDIFFTWPMVERRFSAASALAVGREPIFNPGGTLDSIRDTPSLELR